MRKEEKIVELVDEVNSRAEYVSEAVARLREVVKGSEGKLGEAAEEIYNGLAGIEDSASGIRDRLADLKRIGEEET